MLGFFANEPNALIAVRVLMGVGAAAIMPSTLSVITTSFDEKERGWGDYLTVTTLIVGTLVLISFIFWELHVKNPLLDPRLFKNRGFSGGALSITIQFFGQFGFLFVGMQYLQFVAGFSALGAVLHLLPLPIVMLPMSRFAGANVNKIPQKYMGSFGLVFFAIGMFMFARMDSNFSLAWFTSSLIIFAFGVALAAVPATTAITNSLSADKQGVASAVNDTSREFGSAIGIAVLGAALNNQYRSEVSEIASTLPPDVAMHLLNSVAFTQSTPPPALAANWDVLVATALNAFTHGMSLALNISGAFALIGAVLVFAVAPKKVGKISSD